jgi:hypothetical protein
MKKIGLATYQMEGERGLRAKDISELLLKLDNESEVYPIEIMAKEQECSAMGFIDREFADTLDFEYDTSGLNDFVASILDDVNLENPDGIYSFKGYDIFIGYPTI